MSSNSYSLVEAMVYQFINKIKNDPERNIRNSVDMALNFSKGRFQREFLSRAQKTLKNEHSAYYGLVWDAVNNIDTEKLVAFGMNIGYNSCTKGAETIRRIETEKGFNIPWSMTLKINEKAFRIYEENYRRIIEEGKELGIFTWLIFAEGNPHYIMDIISENTDCAFVIFCETDRLDNTFIDYADKLNNLMLCIKYTNGAAELCERLRQRNMLYSVYITYNDTNTAEIFSDMLLCRAEYLHPIVAVVVPDEACSDMTRGAVYKYVKNSRVKQIFGTVLWEFCYDSLYIDNIISDGPCAAVIDKNGRMYRMYDSDEKSVSCFSNGLEGALRMLFPK